MLKYAITIIFFSLMIFSGALSAEDFRALNLGDSCEGLLPKEENIGGNFNYEYNVDYEYAFTTIFMGKPSSVTYKCLKNNQLKEGIQFVTFDAVNDAVTFFSLAKIWQTNLGYELRARSKIAEKVGTKPSLVEKYHLYWKTENKNVNFSLTASDGKKIIVVLLVSAG